MALVRYGHNESGTSEELVKRYLALLIEHFEGRPITPQDNPRARRTKRRNSDDRLRKLERASRSGEAEAVLAYWSACWRAGEVPKERVGEYLVLERPTPYRLFNQPTKLVIFPNGWGLVQWYEGLVNGEELYSHLPMKLQQDPKLDSGIWVDTPIGRWIDLYWRDIAIIERSPEIWGVTERRLRELQDIAEVMATLRTKPSQVLTVTERSRGA